MKCLSFYFSHFDFAFVLNNYAKNLAKHFAKVFCLLCLFAFVSCSRSSPNAKTDAKRKQEVVVYTYDSFISEWGPGAKIADAFQKQTGIKCSFVQAGDAAALLSRAIIEKDAPQADVILGLDNNFVVAVHKADIFAPYKPQNSNLLNKDLEDLLGGKWLMTPYDFSHFALIFDTQSDITPPGNLMDLTKPEYQKKLILMDPRTSTPGLGFVAWTQAVFKEKALDFWKALKPSILTVAPGWSSGYALFQKGEAPLVISYTTSPAAQIEYDNKNTYKALIFQEGHPIQVEGAGILKNAPNIEGAKKFVDFLITTQAQSLLPLTQWMYPANKDVPLPECYKSAAPIPQKTLVSQQEKLDALVDSVIKILNE